MNDWDQSWTNSSPERVVVQDAASYFHTQALLLDVLAVIAPHVRHAVVELPPLTSHQRVKRVATPRWREFHPIRREAVHVAALMQSDIARRWPLAELAEHARLSTNRLAQVFIEAFGVTPNTYLSILRAQRMAKLVRETDQPVTTIYQQVGWASRGHGAIIFRRYLGVNPSEYRRYGPPSVNREGPGVGVARAGRAHQRQA